MNKELSTQEQTVVTELILGLRLVKALSQKDVYDECGVDISKYESGKCMPKTDAIARLCGLFHVSIAGFWAICEKYAHGKLSKSRAIEILDQWQKYDQVLRLAVEMIINGEKAG